MNDAAAQFSTQCHEHKELAYGYDSNSADAELMVINPGLVTPSHIYSISFQLSHAISNQLLLLTITSCLQRIIRENRKLLED